MSSSMSTNTYTKQLCDSAWIHIGCENYKSSSIIPLNILWYSLFNYTKNVIQCMIDVKYLQYIPRNMHTVFALLCFVVVIYWLIFPYPSGLLHWHCGNLTIAPVPAKQPWWIWINTSCEFIMNDCITTTKQSTTKPCAYFLGYTVSHYLRKLAYQWSLLFVEDQGLIQHKDVVLPVYRKSHCGDKAILWPSCLHSRISDSGKMTFDIESGWAM